jgi:predicted transcriptional regulator
MLQSFTLSPKHVEQLDRAVGRMERSTSLFDQGNREKAEFEGREAASDLNQTIVQLMKSHQQMCQGGGSGNPMKSMQGLSESQDGLNQSTKELLEKLAGKKRLSYSEEQRMAQLAAQQEMIRQGLEELTQELGDAQDLLGDMQQVQEEMEQVEEDLRQKRVDPRIKERQQQILSRLLDAQRSIRQREMSPQRQSRAATLAQRQSPPPLSEDLLRRNRTLEEDVLRGADDRYPSQYRKLVEEYFRALSREDRSP